jgi:hypothetical protein
MKILPLLIAFLLVVSLTGCAGTPLPPTNQQVERTPEISIVNNR